MNREIYKGEEPVEQASNPESLEYGLKSRGKPIDPEQTKTGELINRVKKKFKKTPEEKRRNKIGRDKKIHNMEHKVLGKLGEEREGVVGKSLNWLNEKYGEDWLERRGKLIADRSGVNETIENIEKQKIIIADIGSGKSGINEAIINNSEKDIKILGFDESDRATEKVSESSKRNVGSAYAIGENLPIEDNKVDVVKFDFTFQEADDEMVDKLLEEAERILKDDGIITVIEDLPQEKFIDEQSAKIENKVKNRRPGKLNLHSKEDLEKLFKDHNLEIKKLTEPEDHEVEVKNPIIFGDDEENKKEQFIAYVLEKAKVKEKVEE